MSSNNSQFSPGRNHTHHHEVLDTEHAFCEFRRKVRDSELLSAAIEKLLRSLKYTGKVSVVIQNGEILKCGYEEGYFCRRNDLSP